MGQAREERIRRPEKMHALTSLRFFAALYVVCFHSVWVFLPGLNRQSLSGRFLDTGFLSVGFFFLLSGYILAMVYLDGGSPVDPKAFYRARLARIYPLYLLTLLVDCPVVFLRSAAAVGARPAAVKTGISLAGELFLLQGWNLRFRYLDFPNWSLSVEAFFYLLFPLIGVALWKLRAPGVWVAGAAAFVAGQAMVRLVSSHISGDLAYVLPFMHLATFALGVLLARGQTLARRRGAGTGAHPAVNWVFALTLAGFCAVVFEIHRLPLTPVRDGLPAPLFLGVIWCFSHGRWLPARLLSAPWLVALGEASYGLYLLHVPVLNLFEWFGWSRTAALFPVYLASAIGLSLLSLYRFETPARRWILARGVTPVKETMEMASDAQ